MPGPGAWGYLTHTPDPPFFPQALEREMSLKAAIKARHRTVSIIPPTLVELLHTPTVYNLFYKQALGKALSRAIQDEGILLHEAFALFDSGKVRMTGL